MFDIEIDGKSHKGDVTFETAIIYEQQFGGDMLQDLLGRQGEDDGEFMSFEGEKLVSIDFTKVSWLAVMKVLWAAVKTAEPKTASFDRWTKTAKGVNIFTARAQLSMAVDDCFFRASATE